MAMSEQILLKPHIPPIAGISLPTIRREQIAGRFPPWDRLSAGRVGLRRSRLDAWLNGKRDWTAEAAADQAGRS